MIQVIIRVTIRVTLRLLHSSCIGFPTKGLLKGGALRGDDEASCIRVAIRLLHGCCKGCYKGLLQGI